MTEKKETVKKAAAPKAAAVKKETAKKAAPAKRTAAKKAELVINAESVGFRAGDVYQTLAKAEKPLSVAEIAKSAGISSEEALLGIGWLFKELKVTDADNKIVLA